MPAQADIIVSSPDSSEVKLVVEAKLRTPDLRTTEHQLKNFMLQLRCPLGILVSPQHLWVYLDRFTSYSEDSIERLGEFNIEGLIKSRGRFVGRARSQDSAERLAQDHDARKTLAEREDTFHRPSPDDEVAFENAVQAWLEDLSKTTRDEVKDPKLWEVINHYILPAVETGVVRAAGPR